MSTESSVTVSGFPVKKSGERLAIRNRGQNMVHIARENIGEARSFSGKVSGRGSERWTLCGNSADSDVGGRDVVYIDLDGDVSKHLHVDGGYFGEICGQCLHVAQSMDDVGFDGDVYE